LLIVVSTLLVLVAGDYFQNGNFSSPTVSGADATSQLTDEYEWTFAEGGQNSYSYAGIADNTYVPPSISIEYFCLDFNLSSGTQFAHLSNTAHNEPSTASISQTSSQLVAGAYTFSFALSQLAICPPASGTVYSYELPNAYCSLSVSLSDTSGDSNSTMFQSNSTAKAGYIGVPSASFQTFSYEYIVTSASNATLIFSLGAVTGAPTGCQGGFAIANVSLTLIPVTTGAITSGAITSGAITSGAITSGSITTQEYVTLGASLTLDLGSYANYTSSSNFIAASLSLGFALLGFLF